jgi:triphosphoribosyl-dephospho-CoA synthase
MFSQMNTGLAASIACILEATARKPGNVHRTADFAGDAHYLDFLLSAAAISNVFANPAESSVGEIILKGVTQTRSVVSTNTNLGILLLMAPLAKISDGAPVRTTLNTILEQLTVEDARVAYRAIQRANPGGLNQASEQDIRDEPTVTLLEAMKLAADRDLIARQYATGFVDLFEISLPALAAGLEHRWEWHGLFLEPSLENAIIFSYLTLLSERPDTLIARKRGTTIAEESARRAAEALKSCNLTDFDRWLRADGHARNPGASADLMSATLFVALRNGTIALPRGESSWNEILPRNS